jgi:hypothetical protein
MFLNSTVQDRTRETGHIITSAIESSMIALNILPDYKYHRMNQYILDSFRVFPDFDIGGTHTLSIGNNECKYDFISNVVITLRGENIANIVKSLIEGRHDEFMEMFLEQQRRNESGLSAIDWHEHRRRVEKNPFTLPEAINGFDWGVNFLDPRSRPLIAEILDKTLRIIADTDSPVDISITYDLNIPCFDAIRLVKIPVPIWILHPSPVEKLTLDSHHLAVRQIFGGVSLQYSPLPLRVNMHEIYLW